MFIFGHMKIIINKIYFSKEKYGSPTIWESKLRLNCRRILKSRSCATWRSRTGIYRSFEVTNRITNWYEMLQQNRKAESQKWGKQDGCRVNLPAHIFFLSTTLFSCMGCWQKQEDSKPSASIPNSTTLPPSSHDTTCSLPSHIVLTGSFSPSENCWLTTRNFSAHNFLQFSSPPFMNLPLLLPFWLCVADALFVYKPLRDIFSSRGARRRARRLARNAGDAQKSCAKSGFSWK